MKLFDRDLWSEVWETHGRNKRRSIVTALGVFWGIFILIVLLAVSAGFSNGIAYMTRSISSNGAYFWAGRTTLPYEGFGKGRAWRIEHRDLEHIRRAVPELSVIAGSETLYSFGGNNLHYGEKRGEANITGVTEEFFKTLRLVLVSGRMLNLQDHREMRKYCLIGKESARQLFGDDPKAAIGKSIKAENAYYTIVGVVQKTSSQVNIGLDPDRTLWLPYSVMDVMRNLGGRLGSISIDIRPGARNAEVVDQVKRVLKSLHHIAPEDEGAVGAFDVSNIFRLFEGINLGISILVWLVGIGTLLTGVVGISNILLVTVRERTQEIGVRRAIGAKPRDIITQLLLEALSLTLVSGLLGIVLGVGVTSILSGMFTPETMGDSKMPFVNPMVSLELVTSALVVIVGAGVLAGMLPALKAVEIRAIEAIREE